MVSIMPRGGKRENAGRRTRQEKHNKPAKKILSCRVEVQTLNHLKEIEESSSKSKGEIVDLAIELLQEHPEKLEDL